MKKRILCRLLSMSITVFMAAGCSPVQALGAVSDSGSPGMNQSAVWTDEEYIRGELRIELSGMKEWYEAYRNSRTEMSGEMEEETEEITDPASGGEFLSEDIFSDNETDSEIPGETQGETETQSESEAEILQDDMEIFEADFSEESFSGGILTGATLPGFLKKNIRASNMSDFFEPGESDTEVMLVTRISQYFQVTGEELPKAYTVTEALYPGNDGGLERASEVVCRILPERMNENIITVKIPVILREEYRDHAGARNIPVHYRGVTENKEQIEDAVSDATAYLVLCGNGRKELIIQDHSEPVLEIPAAAYDYTVSVNMETETPKPGQTLRYQVNITNTGLKPFPMISLESSLMPDFLTGIWSLGETDVSGQRAILTDLNVGESRQITCLVNVPEDFSESEITNTITAFAQKDTESEEPVVRSGYLRTEVTPLKVDFTVHKTADRTSAAPGDTITYQICIRNTGERTLHSVLSTERFQTENIRAYFLEQEGVLLSSDKTQALISQIPPGEVFSLEAEVILPETLTDSELINQVLVRTRETGDTVVEASSGVQIMELSPSPVVEDSGRESDSAEGKESSIYGQIPPKTSDDSQPFLWAILLGVSFLLFGVSLAAFWKKDKNEKRKH